MNSKYFCVIEPVTITPALLTSTNVPETEHPEHSMVATYGDGDLVQVAAEHQIYKSAVAGNVGHAPATSPTYWVPQGATNPYRMFDEKVNTQTTHADSIVVEVTLNRMAGGLCLANVEADEVEVSVTDPLDGEVYNGKLMAEKANSGSSAWNWCFKRIRRRTLFTWTDLPPYYGATIKIEIRKPGGIAKCGMCNVGPLEEIGLTKYGLSPEIKDYSTNLFDRYGNLTTTELPWGKKLSVNVEVDNAYFDDLQLLMVTWRAKPVVWIAASQYESTVLYARYVGFKPILANPIKSDMALNLEGLI